MVNTIPKELEHVRSVIVENGLFQVFENGRIFRIDKRGKKECAQSKQHNEENSYYRVTTTVKGKQKKFYVHRLIAKAFIPNPENKIQVNHLDGDKTNHEINNLEWSTPTENVNHAYKIGLINPYIEGTICVVCGLMTRAEHDICTGCKVGVQRDYFKQIAATKRKDSIAHIDVSILTTKQKKVIEMRSLGMSSRDISESLGVNVDSVKSLISTAKKRAIRKSKRRSHEKFA